MRTDPRKLDFGYRENKAWAVAHDLFFHPLLACTLYSRWAIRLHTWSSYKAWPRVQPPAEKLAMPRATVRHLFWKR